jgi:hypothetical protein
MALSQAEIDQFHGMLASGGGGAAKPQAKGSFLTHLLPSVGGIAGGVGGGAIGGALAGSAILPGVGTAVGGLLGALLGGAGGGALGKVAENAVEHQALGNGVAKEAAINGVMSAGPLRLLKGVGTAGKVLAGLGDNEAAAQTAAAGGGKLLQALNAGGVASAAPSAFKTAVANKLDDTAASMAQKGLKINDSSFLSNFNKQAGESVGDFARRFGVPHNGLESTVEKVLQPGFAAHAGAIDAIGSIPKTEVLASIKAQVSKELDSKVPDSQAFGKTVMEKAQGVLDNFGDHIPASELNKVKTEIAAQVNHAATDTASKSSNEVLNRVSSGFRQAINGAADKVGIGVDPALAKLGYKSTDVGGLGEELNHLKTLLDKAEVKSWTGSGTNPISLTGAAAAGGIGGPAGIATGLATQAINSSAGKKGLAKGIDAIASRVDKSAVKSSDPNSLVNISKRVAPVGLLGALAGSQSNSAQMTTDPTMNTSANTIDSLSQNTGQNASATPDASQDPNSPFNPANIEANVQKILSTGGKMSDATAYLGLVKTMQDLTTTSQKPLNSTQQQQAFNAQSGLTSLQDIATALQNNPNEAKLAALPGGGLTSSLTGTGSYKAAIANATDVIGRLRSGGAIGKEEEQQFKALLPQTFDTPQTANYKLNQLSTLFSQFANPQAAAADPSTLLSALGAQ